ncbi:dTMP kinase [Levilinea saccharolytica]|uniref:Thymidylate kinase n=1 Tax=Levilinea saccharolytica TaxID=229921 RepID=A0A0P6XMV7_9CHLR|nr:dTMP kinase [Levilinea saccharolytica]KPL84881.1 hypothetical protein ADN01_07345 [Levilinea saccharolytica]GAP18405.1 thymidylate kinase [Levilinea saccharolytica]
MMSAPPSKMPLIALVGVDGSGKSSVIQALQAELQAENIPVHVLHGNNLLPKNGPITNHQHPPRPFFSSCLKMLYRALRWLGHYYLHLRPRMNSGVLLLSDRHYFDDVAIDPRKYRYGGPHALVNRLRCRLPRPDLFIFLDATPEVLLSRKQEIPLDEVVRLRAAYQSMLACQPNTRQVDASAPLPQVLAEVRAVIQPYLPAGQS